MATLFPGLDADMASVGLDPPPPPPAPSTTTAPITIPGGAGLRRPLGAGTAAPLAFVPVLDAAAAPTPPVPVPGVGPSHLAPRRAGGAAAAHLPHPPVAASPASDLSAAFTLGCDIFDEIDDPARSASAARTGGGLAGIVEEEDDDVRHHHHHPPPPVLDDDDALLLAHLDGLDLPPLAGRGLSSSYAPGAAFPHAGGAALPPHPGASLSPASAAHAGYGPPRYGDDYTDSDAYGSFADGGASSAYGSFASSYAASSYASVPSLAAASHPLAAGGGGFGGVALSPAHAAAAPDAALRRVPSAPSVRWPAPGTSPSLVVGSAPHRASGSRAIGGALGPRGASGGLPRRGPLSATPPTLKPSPSAPTFSARGRPSRPPRRPLDDDDDPRGRGGRLHAHNPWSLEETAALVAGVEACGGGKWADIKKLGLPAIEARSAVDLKDKWRNLTRLVTLPAALPRALARADGDRRRLPADLLDRVRALLPPADAPYGRLTPSRIPGARSRARQRQR